MVSDIASRTLKRVLEASPMPLTLASPVFEGCPLILANDAFLALTGYVRDDVVGRSCNMLQGPASDQAARAEMRTAVAEAREATVQITNYRRDGSRFMNLVFLMPVFAGDVLKGAAAAGVGLLLAPPGDWWVGYVAGFAAMVGHAWPVFARFRGGRSVLTFAGAVCVLSPVAAAVSIGVLVVVMLAARSFAWGARAGVVAFPFVQIVVEGPYRTAATGCLMTLIGVRFAQAALLSRTSDPATSADA